MIDKVNKTKQALWVGIGNLSTFLFTIIITAILARYLPKEELGTYRQVLYVYNTLVIIFTGGLPRVFAYYLPRYDLAEGKAITNKIINILFLCGLTFSIFLFFTADFFASILKNPQLKIGIKYFAIIPTLLLPTLGIEGIFSSYQKTTYIALYNISTKILMLCAISLVVLRYGGTFENAIIGWIISSALALFFALYLKTIPFKNVESKIPELKLKQILSYSLPIVFASLSGMAIRSADQFFISRYFGPEIFAEFANGFIQIPFVTMITGATSTVLMPIFSKMNTAEGSNKEIAMLWKNALTKSAYLIYPMIFFFLFFAESIIKIIYTDVYIKSAIYFQIAMILNFFNIIIFAPLLLSMGKTKLYAQIHLFYAVTIWFGGYIVVILFNSPYLLAGFSILNNILLIITSFAIISKLLGINIFTLFPFKEVSKIIFASLISIMFVYVLINLIVYYQNYITRLTFGFITYVIILILFLKLFKINYIEIIKPLFIKN